MLILNSRRPVLADAVKTIFLQMPHHFVWHMFAAVCFWTAEEGTHLDK